MAISLPVLLNEDIVAVSIVLDHLLYALKMSHCAGKAVEHIFLMFFGMHMTVGMGMIVRMVVVVRMNMIVRVVVHKETPFV